MAVALHIGRMANRYHLLSDRAVENDQGQLDRMARFAMPRAMAEQLPAVLAACGIAPEAEVVIRCLRLRLRGDIDLEDDSDLIRAWSTAAVDALRTLLSGSGSCVLGEDIAVFPDRLLLEVAYLSEKVRGAAVPWWFEALAHKGGRPSSPQDLIRGWISGSPARAVGALMGLASLQPRDVGCLVGGAGWRDLTAALILSRQPGLGSPSGRFRGRDRASPPAPLAPARKALLKQISKSAGGTAMLRFWVLVLHLDQDPGFAGDLEAGVLAAASAAEPNPAAMKSGKPGAKDAAPGPDFGEDAAAAARKPEPPRIPDGPNPTPAPVAGMQQAAPIADRDGTVAPKAHKSSEPAFAMQRQELDTCGTSGEPLSRPEDLARRISELKPAALRRQTLCAGLLFLLRPLLSDPRWKVFDQPPSQLFCAIAGQVLNRLAEPLDLEHRDAVIGREDLALAVFAGLRDVRAVSLAVTRGRECSEALIEAILADLIERIPDALSSDSAALSLFYGKASLPDSLTPGHEKLARLVLRRAELVVTPAQADLYLSSEAVDLSLRRLAWDTDPGWVPVLGRVIRFHFGEPTP